MSSLSDSDPWADFWAAHCSARPGGCLPEAYASISVAQTSVWQAFAAQIGRGARVLDLATGDGAVLTKILRVRKDLRLIGVDSSPSLPPSPKGITLRAGVFIENLPLPDSSFDGVTSQFGYEYANTSLASHEVSRVLGRGGRFLFIIHRRDGPILAHNLPRRKALLWALSSGYLDKARRLVLARQKIRLPTPSGYREAVREAKRLFPAQTAASELLQAIVLTLEMGRNAAAEESLDVLDELERKARNEIGRIDSLERAACDLTQLLQLGAELSATGLEVANPGGISETGAQTPFAWILTGSRLP